MSEQRRVVVAIIVTVAAVLAGLALPGAAGGAILLALAVVLAVLTTAVHRPDRPATVTPGTLGLRIVVIAALAAGGLLKLF